MREKESNALLAWRQEQKRLKGIRVPKGGELPKDSERLLRVTTDYFVAGAIFRRTNGVWGCAQAAPIINWMRGKSPDSIKLSLLKMGAIYEWICCDTPCSTPEAEDLKSTGVAGLTGDRRTASDRSRTGEAAGSLSLQTVEEAPNRFPGADNHSPNEASTFAPQMAGPISP